MSAHLAPVPTSDLYTWRSGVERLSPPKALADPEAKPGWRRTMARTAILMGRPEEA